MVPGSRLNQGFIDRVLNDPKLLFSVVGGLGVVLITAWALSTSLPDPKGREPKAGDMAHVLPAPEAARSFEDPRALKPGERHMGVKKFSLNDESFETAKALPADQASEAGAAASADGPQNDATADAMKKFEEMQK